MPGDPSPYHGNADVEHVRALTDEQLQARLDAHALDPANPDCALCTLVRSEIRRRCLEGIWQLPLRPGLIIDRPGPVRATADVIQVTPCRPVVIIGVASPLDVLQAAEWDAKLERLFAPARPVIVPFVTSTQVIR